MIDASLKNYATPGQQRYIDAVNALGSIEAAAKSLGVSPVSVDRALRAAKSKAALSGIAPESGMTHEVPHPFVVKGVSTLYDENGNQRAQWVKTSRDDTRAEEVVRQFVESVVGEIRGKSPAIKPPKYANDDLLAVYPMGDPHFGMYAWAKESGEDFDLETAERLTLGAIDRLVASAPSASTAIILPLGDFFHADDQTNQTPGHKHQLDVDSRYPKVLMVGIKALRHCILRALEKHAKVIVRMEPGNHDPHAKWALALTIAAYFENDDRVEVDLSPSKFWYYRFGKVLLGSTHGDTVKHEALEGVMASDRPEDWGLARYRYWYTGHVHHSGLKEFRGCVCESFRTLAAKDAYAAGHGYRAGRDMVCIVHHKDYGEIERHRCDVAMLQ